jgi:hypothetical protein
LIKTLIGETESIGLDMVIEVKRGGDDGLKTLRA